MTSKDLPISMDPPKQLVKRLKKDILEDKRCIELPIQSPFRSCSAQSLFHDLNENQHFAFCSLPQLC